MHPKRPAVIGLALCAITGLAACGATHETPPPPPPKHTAIVYEIRGFFPDDGWVWRADTTGDHPTRLTRGQAPAVAPDGQSVAFIRYQPNPAVWSVWTTDLSGADARQIYTHPGNIQDAILSVVWSPDSHRLAVVDEHGVSCGLHRRGAGDARAAPRRTAKAVRPVGDGGRVRTRPGGGCAGAVAA